LFIHFWVRMDHFKPHERELIKVANYFKRQSKKLIGEGKLGEEHRLVEEAVDKFIAQMTDHSNIRASILEQRDYLNKLVKDNAECPKCHTKDMIKLVGTDKNEKGWKSNRYKCRKCNIQFTWNRPNNPWDMIKYIDETIIQLQTRSLMENVSDEEKEPTQAVISSMEGSLSQLKPVIEAHDKEYEALMTRDEEMGRLIHEFKNTLLIEKIKMDTWENKKKN
jgi:transposase-like protein